MQPKHDKYREINKPIDKQTNGCLTQIVDRKKTDYFIESITELAVTYFKSSH